MSRTLALSLLLGVLAPWRLAAQCPDGSPPPCRAPAQRAVAAPAPNSVAVLYFNNLSRDTADAYLAHGLTEEIIARLRQVGRLSVKSRTAVERFRGKADDPAVLGRALGVVYLVNGSVRRAGQRLRVTVELVRAATGAGVWGDQYDRSDADLLAVEEDIARAVARAVAGRLLPQEQASLAARPTRHPEAYDHFLRGNYELARRTPRAAARAIEEYEAAVRLDPGFTRALARIPYAYGLFLDIGWTYPGLAPESLLARGWTAVERALEQDSSTSDAWMARGYLLSFRYPRTFDDVRSAFDRAIVLDPRNAEAHHQYGGVLRFMGDDSAAVRANRRALELEPERAVTMVHLASLSVVGHRYTAARRWMDSALAMDPGFQFGYPWRALLRVLDGDAEGARSDAETAMRLRPDDRLWGAAALERRRRRRATPSPPARGWSASSPNSRTPARRRSTKGGCLARPSSRWVSISERWSCSSGSARAAECSGSACAGPVSMPSERTPASNASSRSRARDERRRSGRHADG